MKFYDCKTAPSPRRARIFIAEKSLEIPTIEVDLGGGEQFKDEFKALNPRCTVPVLQLDDGTALTENIGIATYLENHCPEPPLMGTTAIDKGLVSSWNAWVEFDGLMAVAEGFRNRTKGMKDHAITGPVSFAQIPALAERGLVRTKAFFDNLDARLAESPYIAGDTFSLADITALCVVDFAAWIKVTIDDSQSHLRRWHDDVSARPSAKL